MIARNQVASDYVVARGGRQLAALCRARMNPALRVELYAPGDCLLFGDALAETYVKLWPILLKNPGRGEIPKF
jgi:hypothetical protein